MLPQFSRAFRRMHLLNDLLRSDLEYTLNRRFQTFDMLENRNTPPRVDENTHYKMKYIVDDNGHVKVKTVHKEPGKEWNIQVKEYDRRNNMDAIEQSQSEQKVEAIEAQKQNENATLNTKVADVRDTKATNVSESNSETNMEDMKMDVQSNKEVSKRTRSEFDEFDSIFDSINRDFETSMRRAFGFFDPFYHPEEYNRRGNVNTYKEGKPQNKERAVGEEKKTNDNSHLNTAKADTNNTDMKNSKTGEVNDKAAEIKTKDKSENTSNMMNQNNNNDSDYELTRRDVSGFDEIQTIFDNMNREFENSFRRSFGMFDPFGSRTWRDPFSYRIEFDPEHTFYNMRSVVNDNGQLRVKTARKEPGKDWDVRVEEYNGKDKAIEQEKSSGKKENDAIGEEKTNAAQIAN